MSILKFLFSLLLIIQVLGWYSPQTVIRWGRKSSRTRLHVLLFYGLCTIVVGSFYLTSLSLFIYVFIWSIFLLYEVSPKIGIDNKIILTIIKNISSQIIHNKYMGYLKSGETDTQYRNLKNADITQYKRHHIPASVRREVWRRDQGKCAECESMDKLEYDHIIPISKGGSNTARNIRLLCEKCNRTKGANI